MTATDPFFDESDLDNPSYYCRHGTFIGNPYGADYMCGWCEMGEEPPTEAEQLEAARREVAAADHQFERLAEALREYLTPHRAWSVFLGIAEMETDPHEASSQARSAQRAYHRLENA